eukprot:scaffold2552_cov380-Prasinococcus_capsulatus_cf.AAC.34
MPLSAEGPPQMRATLKGPSGPTSGPGVELEADATAGTCCRPGVPRQGRRPKLDTGRPSPLFVCCTRPMPREAKRGPIWALSWQLMLARLWWPACPQKLCHHWRRGARVQSCFARLATR